MINYSDGYCAIHTLFRVYVFSHLLRQLSNQIRSQKLTHLLRHEATVLQHSNPYSFPFYQQWCTF